MRLTRCSTIARPIWPLAPVTTIMARFCGGWADTGVGRAVMALRALLDRTAMLSGGEQCLMEELLDRIADAG